MLRWFEEMGENNDIVLSSRVRLARNIDEYKFSHTITEEESRQLLREVHTTLDKEKNLMKFKYYELMDMEEIQKRALLERRAISLYLYKQKIGGVYLSRDEKQSIMINEEDHIRIQTYAPGMNINKAYEMADELDDIIGKELNYAYDDNFGFLTSCPSNVGTGMKATYTLHLPALCNSKKIQGIVNDLGHFGMTMKPVYNNNGNADGHLYQISNQKTFGISEKELLEDLTGMVNNIIDQERKSRKYFLTKERLKIEDEVYKSYGILKYSRKMSFTDAMLLLSKLRMGISLGIIRVSDEAQFLTYQMMMGILPANLTVLTEKEVNENDIDEMRATFIRNNIPVIE